MSKPKYKDPAFLFYTSTFLADTILMNDMQKGQYTMLMALQHLNDVITKAELLQICKVENINDVDQIILDKLTKDENGSYYIDHLRITINKRDKWNESRRKNLQGKTNKSKKKTNNNDLDKQAKNDNAKYFESTTVNKAFNEWLEMRIQIKKPATERAIQIAVNKLNDITKDKNDDYIVNVIEKSTLNNWLSFWPLTETNKQDTKTVDKIKPDFSKYEIY